MRLACLFLLGFLAGCAHPDFPPCEPAPEAGPIAWVVDHGRHTEIGLPAAQVTGPLAYYKSVFPGAKALMFGFGKRTFITAKVETFSELLMGPLPGPAVVQVTGLAGLPGQAYPGRTVLLSLPPGGSEKLVDFLWHATGRSAAGGPRLVADGLFEGSAFWAAARGYDLTYTCNTFTVDALRTAGLPVDTDVIVASGALRQVARIRGACQAPAGPGRL